MHGCAYKLDRYYAIKRFSPIVKVEGMCMVVSNTIVGFTNVYKTWRSHTWSLFGQWWHFTHQQCTWKHYVWWHCMPVGCYHLGAGALVQIGERPHTNTLLPFMSCRFFSVSRGPRDRYIHSKSSQARHIYIDVDIYVCTPVLAELARTNFFTQCDVETNTTESIYTVWNELQSWNSSADITCSKHGAWTQAKRPGPVFSTLPTRPDPFHKACILNRRVMSLYTHSRTNVHWSWHLTDLAFFLTRGL